MGGMIQRNVTIGFYNKCAEDYSEDTFNIDFSNVQKRFLSIISANGFILDFGCGSGRDTKYFLSQGFQVDAIDGSIELCKIASENIGIEVRQMLFQELAEVDKYDGIWACASILHLPKDELVDVLRRVLRALKVDGIIYTSFKYGDFEGERDGRYFTYFTEKSFVEFAKMIPELRVKEQWLSVDVRENRGGEQWLNLILGR